MRGILIVNTGSPASDRKEDVKRFIGDMLSDPLVMTVPDWLRNTLARHIIAPMRAGRSASHYSLIWDKEHDASPQLYHMQALADKIEETTGMPVEIGMRYGMPDICGALERLEQKNPSLHEVVVVPLFPHYAQSSYQTTLDEVGRCFYLYPRPFRLQILEPYFDNENYINALAQRMQPFVNKEYDRLVFSFHSLPLSHVEAGWKKGKHFDYVFQLKETVRLVTNKLNLDPRKNRIVYSSAMGSKWLKPFLDDTIKKFPENGVKKIVILTVGFPADNLESLYDIDMVARELFMKNGGEQFHFVPGLNSETYWADAIVRMVCSQTLNCSI